MCFCALPGGYHFDMHYPGHQMFCVDLRIRSAHRGVLGMVSCAYELCSGVCECLSGARAGENVHSRYPCSRGPMKWNLPQLAPEPNSKVQ